MENTFFLLCQATQFPRLYQHNMLIPWNKYQRQRECTSSHTQSRYSYTPAAKNGCRQAGWIGKIFLIRKQHTPKASLRSEGERELVGGMQTNMNLPLHRRFAAYKHASTQSFIWPSRQHGKMDWRNIASSNFMNQKIRSKNDRLPKEAGRISTHLLFLITPVLCCHWVR